MWLPTAACIWVGFTGTHAWARLAGPAHTLWVRQNPVERDFPEKLPKSKPGLGQSGMPYICPGWGGNHCQWVAGELDSLCI